MKKAFRALCVPVVAFLISAPINVFLFGDWHGTYALTIGNIFGVCFGYWLFGREKSRCQNEII